MANVHSRYNVVVLDDGSISTDEIPSDGSDLSSQEDSDEESNSEDDDLDNIDKILPQVINTTHQIFIKFINFYYYCYYYLN